LILVEPYDDTTDPVFENAYGNDLFAFCINNTSTYLQPDSLFGSVDIIAKLYDDTGLPLPNPVWERLIPYCIEYEIHGSQNLETQLSFIFYGILDYRNNVDVIYKDDAVCDTRGDYDFRDYYFIVTNTDSDSIIEAGDAAYSWVTTDFPDGDYWVIVQAYDAAGNVSRDSMLVTVDNTSSSMENNTRFIPSVEIFPNPVCGSSDIMVEGNVTVLDVTGRVVGQGSVNLSKLIPGVYFIVREENRNAVYQKIVVVGY
jgi:hypothetical protein